MEATVVDGNGTETGHIIVTTIGGRNGQPKQVYLLTLFVRFEIIQLLHLLTGMILQLCANVPTKLVVMVLN